MASASWVALDSEWVASLDEFLLGGGPTLDPWDDPTLVPLATDLGTPTDSLNPTVDSPVSSIPLLSTFPLDSDDEKEEGDSIPVSTFQASVLQEDRHDTNDNTNKQGKRERNREASKKYRKKRKSYVAALEDKVGELLAENAQLHLAVRVEREGRVHLRARLDESDRQLEESRKLLQELRAQLPVHTVVNNAEKIQTCSDTQDLRQLADSNASDESLRMALCKMYSVCRRRHLTMEEELGRLVESSNGTSHGGSLSETKQELDHILWRTEEPSCVGKAAWGLIVQEIGLTAEQQEAVHALRNDHLKAQTKLREDRLKMNRQLREYFDNCVGSWRMVKMEGMAPPPQQMHSAEAQLRALQGNIRDECRLFDRLMCSIREILTPRQEAMFMVACSRKNSTVQGPPSSV